jgi:ATP-binding cassette, subfamily C (CFTR/MRP), member 1
MAIFASMIAITVVTPTFLLAMMPIFAVYIAVTNYYRNVARELKRLDSISRSPIYAHFSETLGGLPVIRSYLRQKMYRRVNEVKLDDNIAAYYAMKAVDRWLSVRLEVLGECVRHAVQNPVSPSSCQSRFSKCSISCSYFLHDTVPI